MHRTAQQRLHHFGVGSCSLHELQAALPFLRCGCLELSTKTHALSVTVCDSTSSVDPECGAMPCRIPSDMPLPITSATKGNSFFGRRRRFHNNRNRMLSVPRQTLDMQTIHNPCVSLYGALSFDGECISLQMQISLYANNTSTVPVTVPVSDA